MYIGGVDIGTTGCKIAIYNEKVCLLDTFYDSYEVSRVNGCDEINFEDVYKSVLKILSLASKKYKIDAIAVTSFGESFAMLDENDNIIAPTMLYTDNRGEKEISELVSKIGEEKIAKKTGIKAHAMYSLSKILWIKNNMPEAYKKAKRILLCQDYIIYKLTGVAQIDYSLAERTQIFNIKDKKYDAEIAKLADVDVSLLSKPVLMGTLAGKIKEYIADENNINKDLKIFNGCHDQIANMFGAGVFASDIAMDGSGTIECLCAVLEEIPEYDFYEKGFCCVPYIDGKYATYAFSYGGCCCINEFKSKYAKDEVKYCKENNIDYYDYMESHFSDNLTDLLLLPYFTGAGTPYMDFNIKGAIINLTFENDIFDMYQALLESIGYELKVNYDALKPYGVNINEIKACGGGANSKRWVQMKSDILNTKFKVLDCKEIGCTGTALIALKSMNLIEDINEGYKLLNIEKGEIIPNPSMNEKYLRKYDKYKKIYNLVKQI